jgi:hypothetical protein
MSKSELPTSIMMSVALPIDPIADDFLEGAEGVAAFTGLTRRQVNYLVEKGHLPGVFRLGRKICGLRSEIAAGLRARASGKVA